MTSPGSGTHVASVYADILPDVTGFSGELKAKLGKLNLPTVKVLAKPDVTGFNTALKTALTPLAKVNHKVGIVADLTGFNAALKTALTGQPTVEVKVQAKPVVTGFNAALRTALATLPTVDHNVRATPVTTGFNTALRTTLAALPAVHHGVRLSPNVAGFRARLAAALRAIPGGSVTVNVTFPAASRIGARIGAVAGRAFALAFRTTVAGLGPTPVPAPGPGRAGASGTRDGGAYARTFRAATDSALRDLPTPRVSLIRLPQVDRELNALHRDLGRLNNQRIGIDIDAATALVEVRRIQTELTRLGAQHPNVQVRADTAAAALRLSLLEAQLARLGRASPNVRVTSSGFTGLQAALLGSTSRMQLLITAGLTLGPAIVPAAAAAAAAVASIGGAAISAVAGLGVGVLAISGVVGAVKALNDARNDAAKTGATQARQDKQLASGADQVRSAVESLANTRAQAAGSARQAAQQVADAERGLANAQRDALRAQQDLARAREDAIDAYEDLNSAAENNAISIERANLQLADAEKALQAVKNDPKESRRRIEAELAFREARQQVIDLTTRQGRLAEEQARAAKVGVEGSEQVIAAQDRIRDSQERVEGAERALSEARISAAEQARQSAFSIAQAQQAVISAQRSAATAAVSAAATSGAAMDTLREKMDALSPAGQRFAQFLFSQKSVLLDLRQVAETGVLPGFQRGIEAILPFRGALTGFVRDVADGLGLIFERGLKALTQPQWRFFFSYIGSTAVPTINRLAISSGNVALGLANIVVAFGPMQRIVGDGLINLTEKFERWTAGLRGSTRFRDFIEYAADRGPIVLKTIGDLADTLLHVAEAAAPVGDVVLTVLSGIATALNAIPTPVLTILIGSLAALRIAAIVAPMVLALGAAMSSVAAGTITMRAAMAGTVAFLGGPWVVAIAAATVGIGLLIAHQAKARAETRALVTAFGDYGQALKDGVNPQAQEHAQTVLRQNEALQRLVRLAKEVGVTQADLVDGLNGDAAARGRVNDAINTEIVRLQKLQSIPSFQDTRSAGEILANTKRIEKLKELQAAYNKASTAEERASIVAQFAATAQETLADRARKLREAMTGTATTAEQYGAAIGALSGISGEAAGKFAVLATMAGRIADSQLSAAEQSELFGAILGQLGDSADTSGSRFDALAGVFTAIGDAALDARDKASLLQRAIDQMYGPSIRQTEATEALVRAQDDLAKQVVTNAAGFDLNTAKSGKNRDAILANRDSLQAALQAARDVYVQDIANGVAEVTARERHRLTTQAILDGIPPAQRNTAAVQELNTKYGQIPPVKKTDIQSPGLDEAIKDMVTAHSVQIGLSMKPPWTREQILAEVDFLQKSIDGRTGQSAIRKATGGIIPGWSPHPMADNIPALLTAREFVQPVAAVDHYGVAVMEDIRHRRIPKELLTQRYATGGFVDLSRFPVSIPASVKFPVTAAQMWEQWESARTSLAAGTPSTGGVGGQRMMAILHAPFPGLALYSGYRPGSRTASGALSYHASNRAVDIPPRHDVFRFIHDNYFAQTRELIWLGDYLRNIHNGRHHIYNRTLLNQHGVAGMPNAHIHWAMARGGLVPNVALPYLQRDQGGVIPPGLSMVDNRTGRDEWMFNEQQTRALVGASSGGRASRDVHIYPQRADFNLDDLRAEQARQEALDRVGRPF